MEIPEDKAMFIDGKIIVIKARTYEIEREKVQIINKEINIEMFTIRLLSGKAVTIPNSPDIYKVYDADRVWIDYQT